MGELVNSGSLIGVGPRAKAQLQKVDRLPQREPQIVRRKLCRNAMRRLLRELDDRPRCREHHSQIRRKIGEDVAEGPLACFSRQPVDLIHDQNRITGEIGYFGKPVGELAELLKARYIRVAHASEASPATGSLHGEGNGLGETRRLIRAIRRQPCDDRAAPQQHTPPLTEQTGLSKPRRCDDRNDLLVMEPSAIDMGSRTVEKPSPDPRRGDLEEQAWVGAVRSRISSIRGSHPLRTPTEPDSKTKPTSAPRVPLLCPGRST